MRMVSTASLVAIILWAVSLSPNQPVRAADDPANAQSATLQKQVDEAKLRRPDLVVLDIGLPGMDGLDVTRHIRSQSTTPIVMLTARTEETDRIIGLELGADDYVVKPFSPRELVARVKAVLRRSTGQIGQQTLRVRDLDIDLDRRTVRRGETPIDLTATEFDLLIALCRKAGRVFTRAQLLDSIRGVSFESYERSIDSHIKNLRKKLESQSGQSKYIETVYGVGYRFNDEA